VRRAQVILWSPDGIEGAEIARRLHVSAEAVSRIRRRFRDTGVAGDQRQLLLPVVVRRQE